MMPSRGMGAVRPSKMPKAKEWIYWHKKGRTEISSRPIQRGWKGQVSCKCRGWKDNYTNTRSSQNPVFASQFLSGSKQVVKVVIRGNGAPARHKCWLSSTRNPAGVIKIESSSKKSEELD
jgi:hypothetical protein